MKKQITLDIKIDNKVIVKSKINEQGKLFTENTQNENLSVVQFLKLCEATEAFYSAFDETEK